MVKIYNNISITPPRRRPKGRQCSYIIHMLLHLILMLARLVPNWHVKSIQEVGHQPNQ